MSSAEPGPLEVYDRAAARIDELVRQVKDDQWAVGTPCSAWSVRDLVNHLVGENRWVPALLAGLTIDEVGGQLDGDLLGGDPDEAWTSARAAAAAALHAEGALSRTVQLSFGETTATEYLWQIAADHLVHGWDLAVALGADDRIDADLVEAVAAWFAAQEAGYRSAGAVGDRPELPPGAGRQWQLLAMFGRAEPACVTG
jgi:uncharacterized protein (TIGR03086 family)